MPRPLHIALVGPTGCGKTAVSEVLAPLFGAEIVCADSRQVYRELEIGTGKPSCEERALRPHHLFDALSIGEPASAGWYARAARAACAAIHARGRPALLVGGSGLYLRACASGLFAEPPLDATTRAALRAELKARGAGTLHAELARVDPVAAARIRPRDGQRIVRALEVFRSSGRPLSAWRAEAAGGADPADWVWIGLDVSPAQLARRIEARTRWMFANGLVEESAALVRQGKGEVLRAMRAIGYQQALAVLEGRLGTEAAAAETALRTRQLAKRQRTWFRHQAPVAWIAVGEDEPQETLARRVSERLQVAGRQGKCD